MKLKYNLKNIGKEKPTSRCGSSEYEQGSLVNLDYNCSHCGIEFGQWFEESFGELFEAVQIFDSMDMDL